MPFPYLEEFLSSESFPTDERLRTESLGEAGALWGISVSLFLDQDAVDNLCDADKECEYSDVIRTIYKAPDGQT